MNVVTLLTIPVELFIVVGVAFDIAGKVWFDPSKKHT